MLTFDLAKNAANVASHGVGFEGCEAIFDTLSIQVEDRSVDYGEPRFNVIGLVGMTVMHLTYTTTDDEDTLRPISYRKATQNEAQRLYRKAPR